MRIVFGGLLLIACFFGTLFFRHYSGTLIPYPVLWYLGFILLGIAGLWLITSALKKARNIIEETLNTAAEKFKSTAEKIELDFDRCEFKSGIYSHQVDDPNMRVAKIFAPDNLTTVDTTTTETVIQSYLTYTDTLDSAVVKFVSPSFPFDRTTLKFYVLNHKISLYVDRFNRGKYLFDLKR